MLADFCTVVIAAIAAVGVRFGTHADARSLALCRLLPLLWMTAVRLFGGYERLRTRAWAWRRRAPTRAPHPALLVKGSGAY